MGGSESTPPPPPPTPPGSQEKKKLKELAASFIKEYGSREDRMTQIVEEFKEIADANKLENEKKSINKVEELGKKFMEIIGPLKKDLEEIKSTCEKLEQRSAQLQAGITLTDMEDFQRILRRVSKLARRNKVVLSSIEILSSIEHCQKVVDNFDEMKKELKDFSEM